MGSEGNLARSAAVEHEGCSPLRMSAPIANLDEEIASEAETDSAGQFNRLKNAVNHLTQGLVLFGADTRLIFSNDRYFEIYGLNRDDVPPGCTLMELLAQRQKAGYLAHDVREYHDEIITAIKRGKTTSQYITTTDGRTIHAVNTPLPEGGWVVTHEDVSEQKLAEAQIEHMAHHDALTDLPNRTLFQARLEHALRWNNHNEQTALLFIDLDNFKNINDTLGHQIGDSLLKIVAERLRGCVRETDAVARLGGDEFVVIQTITEGPAEVAELAKRIRETIIAPCKIENHQIVVDTSIGIAISPADGTSPEQLVKNADLALYGAKAGGRGTYRFFEKEMDARMAARHAMELDLRRALVNGEFELHYQPLVDLARNTISCCEALLRWHHPERGLINPENFIPVAEETGLITRIGEWVMRTACHEAARWSDDITLAVNISPVQFRSQDIVQVIVSALAASGLPADRLEIEITEGILLGHTEATLATLGQLQKLGVKVAMDDFGTGYSSLGYLQKFPFNKIKIDASFIKGLSDQADSTAIIRAITGLAGSFRMVTTAEGVETAEQLRIVRELGCTEMQGHLFAQACPAPEIEALLKSRNPSARKGLR